MPSPSDQAQTTLRSMRANSRSPQLPDNTLGAPAQKKGGKKASQPASNSRIQNLQETRKKGRMKLNKSSDEDIASQLQKLDLRRSDAITTGTALVCDDRLTNYHCLWDKNAPECPARLTAVKEKLAHYGLTKRCIAVQAREAVDEEILLVHSPEYLERMKSTQSMTEEELLALSNSYDSIYLHPKSYSSACLAGGSVLQLVDMVFTGEARNGMAVVRPPGHHAQWEKMNGSCMFNHVAMAARYAQHNHGASRVLIVDWDVHHGQGTQYMFEDDPSVLYFSIHRYEEGHCWPHLPESDSNAVGEGRGEGFTINVPWNKVGMTDADYIAAFLNLLLPIAHEFQPHLVLVAAGFDSVVGDPKGEMAATPACFAHLTHLLMPLAGGKLILALEGGYNLRSLAEGSCAALKILLGDPCPRLSSPVTACHSALTSISETIACHYKYWKSLRHYGEVDLTHDEEEEQDGVAWPTDDELDALLDTSMAEVMRELPPERTGLVYDERMMEHFNAWDSHHPELPQRISRIYERHVEQRLVERCCRLPARHASDDDLQMCHSLEYIQTIRSTAEMKQRDLHRLGGEYNSIFINPSSYDCARLATGCSFSAVEAVMTGKVQNAVAIVRPPGHHAERDTACGFCFFNTAALAARYAQRIAGRMLKVMILDWDVHHGNGTQHIFEDDPSVLYASIHRYDHSTFFPASTDANYDRVGRGSGAGFNVNIAWNNSKMGDAEYLMAFHRAVMPIAYEFNPDLVLVSAGFDAARGDPLGGCLVSPEGYAHMIHLLMGLAGGKIVVVLEGGYNLSSISESMTMCTRTLLGDSLPDLGKLRAPHRTAQQSVSNTIRVHKKYWKSLQLNVPEFVTPAEEVAEELSGTPTKSHSPTTEQSTASISLNNSPGRTVTPVDIADKHDTKQAESQVVLLSPLEEPQTSLETGGSQEVRSIEVSIVPASGSKNPGNTLSTENDCELDKAAAPMDQMSSREKPEIPVQNESGHDLILVVKPGIPLSTSMKPWIPEIFEKDHEVGKEGGAGKCISLSGEQMSSVSLKNNHQPEKQEELVYAMPSSRNAENSAMSVKDLEQHTDPMSPLLKTDNPVMSVVQHGVEKGISAVSNLETTMSTENDQKMETDAPKNPFLKFGKQDVAQESRADPGKEPTVVLSLPLSVPEKTKTGLLQLKAQKSVPLVDAMANKNPEKAETATKSGCSAVVEPIKPVDLNKDHKTQTADMKSAAEPAPIEQICDLKAHLGDRQSDSLMSSKDFIVNQSSHERPTLALSSYQSLSSVPVGGARRKVKPCIKLSDASLTAGSSSPTFASSSSPAASSPTSVSVEFTDSSGQTISTAVTTPVSASPEAPLPSSTCLTQLASPAAPPVSSAIGPEASSVKPSSPSMESEGSTISGRKCNVETIVGNEGCHSDDCVVEISLSLQVVDMKDHSQQETPGHCASTSPKKDELLEEATGWTNPLTSRPHCQLFGNCPEEESGTLFAVTPLPWCPHLETVQAVPPCGLNVQEGCCDCGSTVENWVCLVCYEVYCGRYINEHMLMHGLAAGHMVVLSYADLSVWCYSCESYIHNEVLSDVKNVAHRMKFGEDVA